MYQVHVNMSAKKNIMQYIHKIQCGHISNQFPIYNISLESDYIFFYLIIKIFTDISSITFQALYDTDL